jgi:hypothetical protein
MFAPCDLTFAAVIEAAEAAGIVTIFAAGNEGPDPMTLRSPADYAATPLTCFAVGAVDNNKTITGFSSRGPSSCDQADMKPELVACGYQIRSSQKGGGFAVMSGTSMAAPYIAGLVALMRQYNPEATVEEIKAALILAAEDLGSSGEDNTYGGGFPDALKALEFLPSPAMAEFSISGSLISGDGVAMPGETIGLVLTLNNPVGNEAEVTGTVIASDPSLTIINDQADFLFGYGGTMATNLYPFIIAVDSATLHGDEATLTLQLKRTSQTVLDSLEFTLTIGLPPVGNLATLSASRLSFTVTDFAQFGLGETSIYPAGGVGFRFDGGDNLLYEAGLVIGRNPLQMSSSIRDSLGAFAVSDFTPSEQIHSTIATDGALVEAARFVDTKSEIPIPISVSQRMTAHDGVGDVIICEYYLKNFALERVNDLRLAFFADFDLSASGESCGMDEDISMLYQQGQSGTLVGIVALEGIATFRTLNNEDAKVGFTHDELHQMISAESSLVEQGGLSDRMFLVCSRPVGIDPFDSAKIAFALLAGSSLSELYANAVAARQRYDLTTDINADDGNAVPSGFSLHQNYPNPFNPTTTIAFDLDRAGVVELKIFNGLGQMVTTLLTAQLGAGRHEVVWDGTAEDGASVASGIYFYRIQSESGTQSRKMVLLK